VTWRRASSCRCVNELFNLRDTVLIIMVFGLRGVVLYARARVKLF